MGYLAFIVFAALFITIGVLIDKAVAGAQSGPLAAFNAASSTYTGPLRLGMEVRDKVSGFIGIATRRTEFLNGCVQLVVEGKPKEQGSDLPIYSFDVQQLEYVSDGLYVKEKIVAQEQFMDTTGPIKPTKAKAGGPTTKIRHA